LARSVGGRPKRWIPQLRVLEVWNVDDPAALVGREGVRYVEWDEVVHAASEPNDPHLLSRQWAPVHIGASQAWELSRSAAPVAVAVLDTGLDMDHAEFRGQYGAGYDFVNRDSDPADDHGHGTHVAGVIGAATDNGAGVAAVGWGSVVLPVKVLDARGAGTHATIAEGIVWAADHDARVINLSLGGMIGTETLHAAVRYAHERGALLVAAAGNRMSNAPFYPAAYPEALAVAATTDTDARWILSNFGPWLSLAAPGYDIWSTDWSAGYGPYSSRSGTSMAAAHVSAVAALVTAVNPSLTSDDIRTLLEQTAVDAGVGDFDDQVGNGRLDAAAAVRAAAAAADTPAPSPTASPTATATVTASPEPTRSNTAVPSSTVVPSPTTVASVTASWTPEPATETRTPVPATEVWPPVISGILVVEVGRRHVVIRWETDRPTVGRIEFGRNPNLGSWTPLEAEYALRHEVMIDGLDRNANHWLRIHASDESAVEAVSEERRFRTVR
jgi:subtilisin family serine protease